MYTYMIMIMSTCRGRRHGNLYKWIIYISTYIYIYICIYTCMQTLKFT